VVLGCECHGRSLVSLLCVSTAVSPRYIQDTISSLSFSEGHFFELDCWADSSSFGVPNCGDAVCVTVLSTPHTLSGYVNFDNGNNEEDDDNDDNPSATVLRVLFFRKTKNNDCHSCSMVRASMRSSSVIIMRVVTDHRGSKKYSTGQSLYSGAVCAASLSPFIHSPMLAHGTCPRVAHPRGATNHCVYMMCVVVVVV